MTREKFDTEKFYKDSRISTDLQEELSQNPANLAYYASQAAHWMREAADKKTLRENCGSQIYLDLKNGPNKVTEGFIEATQKLNENWKQFNQEYIEANEQVELYKAAVDTLDKKQFSLGSLNAMNRSEFEATTNTMPSSKEEMADRRARFGS